MLFKIIFHSIALVLLLALAAYFFGTGIIDAGIGHLTGGLEELAELAKKLGNDGTAGDLGKKLMHLLGL